MGKWLKRVERAGMKLIISIAVIIFMLTLPISLLSEDLIISAFGLIALAGFLTAAAVFSSLIIRPLKKDLERISGEREELQRALFEIWNKRGERDEGKN